MIAVVSFTCAPDHPRVGGEHTATPCMVVRLRKADHPRVGGEHELPATEIQTCIPSSDHPRVGGEHGYERWDSMTPC